MDGQTLLQRCEDASKKEVKKFFRKEKKREIFPTLFWCFPEDGRTDGQTQGWTDRPSYRDAWMHSIKEVKKYFWKEEEKEIFPTLFWCFPKDGRMDRQTHGQTDRPSYRDAWTHLKKRRKKEKVWQKKNRKKETNCTVVQINHEL